MDKLTLLYVGCTFDLSEIVELYRIDRHPAAPVTVGYRLVWADAPHMVRAGHKARLLDVTDYRSLPAAESAFNKATANKPRRASH